MDRARPLPLAPLPTTAVCQLYRCGQVPYETAWQWQRQLLAQRRTQPDQPDTLLLLEHPAVYTLGQGADDRFLKFTPQPDLPPVIKIERGGEVTYHCPGQLVGYPILNLRRHQPDLHWYLRQLEAVIMQTVAAFGLTGERVSGLTGVWVEGCKVAAIGIKVSRWITMHGLALNINPDLAGFQRIVPCGISDKPVGSLAQFIPGITRQQVQPVFEQQFAEVFRLQLQPQDPVQLRAIAPPLL
ncbi:lipoyl(octanoyl) transferase LipB [Leptolyngbya iicbica]|uniref:Octanoyltransferase n=2 Tax=Cyanophyceae TaxID=3028117 RepID=A0A4Q7EFT8_9CYAN|nr:lipoyl(octanoyl) transferase LipB [Leptolyngbya sp. LK]RZM82112.1 lipoyl(octanoyl) transferase [Leptolyngbya sp. LK]